jgi:outer membrane protein
MWINRKLALAGVLALAAACTVLVGSAAGADQSLKIGYIRSAVILDQFEGARAVTLTFNRDVDAWNQEAQKRRGELDVIGKELEAQSPMLSDAVRRQKEMDYQRKLTDYDQYVQSIWGPNGLVTQRNEELMRPIVDKIQTAARKVASDEDYDLVLDASNGNIIYADKSFDLTDKVLEELRRAP